MHHSKHQRILVYLFTALGLSLITLPLYAELFAKEVVPGSTHLEQDLSESFVSESAIGIAYSENYTVAMMHIPPWVPLAGGIITLIGGFLIGRNHLEQQASP